MGNAWCTCTPLDPSEYPPPKRELRGVSKQAERKDAYEANSESDLLEIHVMSYNLMAD